MVDKRQEKQLIIDRFQRKMSDITILKMQLIRDEQDMIDEFVEDMLEIADRSKEDEIQQLFRGTSHKIRYRINKPYENEDD